MKRKQNEICISRAIELIIFISLLQDILNFAFIDYYQPNTVNIQEAINIINVYK